eukprot:NODE_4191_length_1924_cov_4.988314.p1 GENE.NODE_4191_length_1924_cov_4.988314~~NODE_4191_length_1924_cov_4.988314.p1  ORF type:complete len:609 (+),score=137.93 NODE_4191_length_1924_cov_4.988314:126-1829(+)
MALKGVVSKADVRRLHQIWRRYKDDLTWPWYERKPPFNEQDFRAYYSIVQQIVNRMVEVYKVPMVLDQATISNTNHIGHPPHADNILFDSVWWKGKRICREDEVVAVRGGAYVLWRADVTSYRSYGCTIGLSDPNGYEGGEVQFFEKWADANPVESVKNKVGDGIAFCGCQRNIHAVTSVSRGFRLVLLVWSRPHHVRMPESQLHVCYFRPGTGSSVWLTPADIQHHLAAKRQGGSRSCWQPKEVDDPTCRCQACSHERARVFWADCAETVPTPTPTTSAGSSSPWTEPSSAAEDCASGEESRHSHGNVSAVVHCPHAPAPVLCGPHHRAMLNDVLDSWDIWHLEQIWQRHHDDLSWPWHKSKPEFSDREFQSFRAIAHKVVDAMAKEYAQPLVLDQATISSTNHLGQPPHADNVQFDSAWWAGNQIKAQDELAAARGGAEILWQPTKTSYRNYGASVALVEPRRYSGGELEFYDRWGDRSPAERHRCRAGSGIAYCGCRRGVHAVTAVEHGRRLVLLVWTRPPHVIVPEEQQHVCYFRPGTGPSVWLTSADLENYPRQNKAMRSRH